MERFIILFSKAPDFSPRLASVVATGGPAFPPNSQSFRDDGALVAALAQAGIPEFASSFARQAIHSGINSWLEVDEQQARLFASGHYETT